MFEKCKSDESFIIAEVGQNHQGSVELALKYIDVFAECGADAIKFQTRKNSYLFSKEAYAKIYNSENAFAETYGEHREALELTADDLIRLKKSCHEKGVAFMSTPFDEPSLDLLSEIGVDILKVASFDLGNLPFITKLAATRIPVVMSVGGGKSDQIKASVDILREAAPEIAVLHCVSEYPCPHDRLGLSAISDLILEYPDLIVGLSDHFKGIVSGPIAYQLGARVFEKHVTLDRTWKGTDHSFALMPHGFGNFVRDINRVPQMMKKKDAHELGAEGVFKKLGKSIVAATDLQAGDTLTVDNLSGRIFPDQIIPVRETNKIIGRKLKNPVKNGSPVNYGDVM